MPNNTPDPSRPEAPSPPPAEAPLPERPGTATACGCQWSDRSDHDIVQGIEAASVADVAELVMNATNWIWFDDEDRERLVPPQELREFAAAHDWSDPVAAFGLLRALADVRDLVQRVEITS